MNNLLAFNRAKNDDDNLIPLINIVFLLLIFFMVAGQMRAQLPEQLALPTSEFDLRENQDAHKLHIDNNLQIQIDNNIVNQTELGQIIEQGGGNQSIAIYADASIKAAALADILLTIENAGVTEITLVVENKSGE